MEEKECRDQADGLDSLREEREAVDRLDVPMEEWNAGRDHQGISRDQTHQRGGGRDQSRLARFSQQRDGESEQQHCGGEEAAAWPHSFGEVLADEGAVDARTDRERDDEEATL